MRVHHEHVTHPGQAFRCLEVRADRFRLDRHRHPHLELTWIHNDSGLRLVGDSALPYGPGDLVLLGSELPHTWVSAPDTPAALGTPGAGQAEPLRCGTVLQFPAALLLNAPPTLPELAQLAPLVLQAQRGLQVRGATQRAVCAVLAKMPQASGPQRLAGLFEVLALLHHAPPADLEALASPAAAASARAAGSRRIDRVIAWVHENLSHELSVEDAARLAHVSPAAFSRCFHREVGKPFTEYINDLRCAEASLLLHQGNPSIAWVAQACGYTTLSHFNRQFKRRMGSSPKAWRQGGS